MSTYYSFYLVRKNDKGKYEAVGNYYKTKNGELRLCPIYSRSRSFIPSEDFVREMSLMSIDDMDEEVKNIFSYEGIFDENQRHSSAYYTSLKNFYSFIENRGLIRGYTTLNDLNYISKNNYDPDILEYGEYDLFTPEYIAELPAVKREKYAHISFLDTMSADYIANIVVEAIEEMVFHDDDYYIVMNVE